MLTRLFVILHNALYGQDPVLRLPLAARFAGGPISVEIRRFQRPCGHEELLVDVRGTDDYETPLLLLDIEELQVVRALLQQSDEFVQSAIAEC